VNPAGHGRDGVARLVRWICLVFLGIASSAQPQANCRADVCLDVDETPSAVGFYLSNARYIDVTVTLSLKEAKNVRAPSLRRIRETVAPRQRVNLLVLEPLNAREEIEYQYDWDYFVGDPAAKHDDAVRYRLPFDEETPRLLLQGVGGSFSHSGAYQYSFDFKMPIGTTVLAARDGVVARVIDGFTKGGPDPRFTDQANLVTIRHADRTYGEYVHLDPGGILVHEGAEVHAGQPLAKSGDTGFTSEPHLHFMVWKATANGRFESVPIQFDDGTPEGFVPRQDLWYGADTDVNAGGSSSGSSKTGGSGNP
jgi:murein DD-endopeptidase MepM/ murein hydrolase activator NlpD